MVRIRLASAADAPAIARVRYESWRAAYAGIIPAEIIERVTGRYDAGREQTVFASRPWRRTLVAEQTPPPASAPGEIVGYASYGPERGPGGIPLAHRSGPQTRPETGAGRRAELYALYVAPAWWSTGTGHALTRRVLDETRSEGYPRISLWVLEQNARARRFYERSGFRLQGRTHVMHELGGVTEVCYERAINPL